MKYESCIFFLSQFIFFSKKLRHNFRHYFLNLTNEDTIKSCRDFKRFHKYQISEKSILLVEPNPYHGVIIPGVTKYLQDIGYTVDVLLQPTLEKDAPYARFPNTPQNIFYMIPKFQRRALRMAKIKNYDFIFFTTSVYWADGIMDGYLHWLGFVPQAKYGFLQIEHDLISQYERYGHRKWRKRCFAVIKNEELPQLTLCYFGDIKNNDKSNKTRFVAVCNQVEPENPEILFNALRQLLKRGISDFSVIIAGRTVLKELPDDLTGIVSMTGLVTCPQLWERYEESDFVIPMLNPESRAHDRYKSTALTGAYYLVLGFAKPALIESSFASSYKFDEHNAILYNGNAELANAMERAIRMQTDDYQSMRKNIRALDKDLRAKSLENLKNAIISITENKLFCGDSGMKIAIEASVLAIHLTGVAKTLMGLLEYVQKNFTDVELALFCDCRMELPKELPFLAAHIKYRNSFFGRRKLKRILSDFDFIYYPWNGKILPFIPRGRNVLQIHDVLPLSVPGYETGHERFRVEMRKSIDNADIIFTDSEYSKRDIMRNFELRGKDPAVLHWGVKRLETLRCLPSEKENYYFYVGGYDTRKGLHHLLRDFLISDKKRKLMMVGDAWHYNEEFKRDAAAAKRKGILAELGYVPEEEMQNLLAWARALIYPSKWEGFGIPPLEAMAAGTVVITTRGTSLPEICGDAALYFDPEIPGDLNRVLDEFEKDERIADGMLANAAKNLHRFDWDKTAEKFITTLLQCKG